VKNDCYLGSHLKILALAFSPMQKKSNRHLGGRWKELDESEMSPVLHSLRRFPLVCRDVEAEAIVWRLAEFVQFCYTRAELHRI
jgi:hypothetical protein